MNYANSFPKIQSSSINFPALTGTKTELAVPQTNAVVMGLYLSNMKIPFGIYQQAEFWANEIMGGSASPSQFIEAVNEMPERKSPPVDFLIIVDTSIQATNSFFLTKISLKELIKYIILGNNGDKIALAQYSSIVQKFHSFSDPQDFLTLSNKLDGLTVNATEPRPEKAINSINSMFVDARPQTEAIPKVVIFILHGRSNNPETTINTAEEFKNTFPSIELFVLLINSDADLKLYADIRNVASNPPCNHVFQVQEDTDILSTLDSIKSSAKNSRALILNQVANTSLANFALNWEVKHFKDAVNPENGRKYTLKAIVGTVTMYFSRFGTVASSVKYDAKIEATDGQEVSIYFPPEDLTTLTTSSRRKRASKGDMSGLVSVAAEGTGSAEIKSEEVKTAEVVEPDPNQNTMPCRAAPLFIMSSKILVGLLILLAIKAIQ